jgi:hypothetical protein
MHLRTSGTIGRIISTSLSQPAKTLPRPILCERRFHYIHVKITMTRTGMRRARVWNLASGASASAGAATGSAEVTVPASADPIAFAGEHARRTGLSQLQADKKKANSSHARLP